MRKEIAKGLVKTGENSDTKKVTVERQVKSSSYTVESEKMNEIVSDWFLKNVPLDQELKETLIEVFPETIYNEPTGRYIVEVKEF